MDFLFPYALLGLAAVGGLVAAYLLRARFRRKPVSALFLWSGVAPATGAGRRRDRLRTPPPFFLELAALVCLALAAASPFVRRGAPPAPTLVLDDSASMSARDPAGATPATRAAAELPRLLRDAPFVRVVLASHPAPQSLGLLPRAEALALLRDPARFAAPGDSLDSSVALAERLRSGDGAILVVTDRAPVRPLPPGSRHLAFGRPLPNAALSARRALAADGSESLLLSLRRFPDSPEPLPVSVSIEDPEAHSAFSIQHSALLSPAEPKAIPLPSGCPTLRVSIPEDALALDNEAILPTAVPPPVPVLFDLSDPALLSLARRAVEATGLADLAGAEPGHQDSTSGVDPEPGSGAGRAPARPVLLTDSPDRLRAHRGPALLLVPASGARTLAGPWLRDPADPLLEGVDFTGLAWPLPAPSPDGQAPPSAIPGRPLLYCADTPILSILAGADIQSAPSSIQHSAFGIQHSASSIQHSAFSIQHYALCIPPPASPFFRSTAWPSLVYNLLSLAQSAGGSEATHSAFSIQHSAFESDLSSCATLSLSGPPLPPSESSGDLRPLALFFGLAAFLLILLRFALPKR